MTPILTDEQRHALEQTNELGPVTVVDASSGREFVLVSASLYKRLQALLEGDTFDIRETYAAQDAAADQAWDDPGDADYDQYDSIIKTP